MIPPRSRPGVAADIAATLRERIIDGTYAPGYPMNQELLAAELRVSRTPLREALQRLVADGLVVAQGKRGLEVAPLTLGVAEEQYAARLLLEPPIISEVMGHFTPADLAEMDEHLRAMEDNAERTKDFQDAHLHFHTVGIRRYPPLIAQMSLSLHQMIYRHQRVHLSLPRVPEEFVHADRVLLEAMRHGDRGRTRAVLEFHLIDAALGLIHQSEPDHRFSALLVAANSCDIVIGATSDGHVPKPTTLRWDRGNALRGAGLRTANLVAETSSPRRTRPARAGA